MSLRPYPRPLVYLGLNVELGQEGLHDVLILDGHEAGFKILGDI